MMHKVKINMIYQVCQGSIPQLKSALRVTYGLHLPQYKCSEAGIFSVQANPQSIKFEKDEVVKSFVEC